MKTMMYTTRICVLMIAVILTGCATTDTSDQCKVTLKAPLRTAMSEVEARLASGCEGYYESYVADLIDIAVKNPDSDNKRAFSDFLVTLSDKGTISKRQASELYNRYFNIKFVSLAGDFTTCSQVCPVQDKVLMAMRAELLDKEAGLLKASNDSSSYYRSDLLLQESEIVLEATCRACSNGGAR